MSDPTRSRNRTSAPERGGPADSVAFLVAKVGFHAAARFAQRLAEIGLEPRHVGLLRAVEAKQGQSQQDVANKLQLPPSRMVAYVDDLEQRGLVERRPNPSDRRAHALHLTRRARRILREIVELSIEHEREICAGLDTREREHLVRLLTRLAENQDLPLDVHPGLVAGGPPV